MCTHALLIHCEVRPVSGGLQPTSTTSRYDHRIRDCFCWNSGIFTIMLMSILFCP